jgi:RNA polymerase sigma-70 factor (ECF subfamily)
VAVDAARGRAGVLTRKPEGDAAWQAGDLYSRFRDRIYGYCLYQLGSAEEAEDALQTTFLYAFRGLRRGVVPVAEGPWLFTIARNACLERHRSRRRRRPEILSDPQVLESGTAAVERNGDDGLRLQQALGHLPEQQRMAFVLREWRGLSYREIAAEMDISLSAVETLIFRARRALAQLLTASDEARPQKRRLARALDLGSLAAALKSLLGGSSAAKLAAAAAVVSSAAVAAGTLAPGPAQAPAPAAAPVSNPGASVLATELAHQRDLRGAANVVPEEESVGTKPGPAPEGALAGAAPPVAESPAPGREPKLTQSPVAAITDPAERLASDAGVELPAVDLPEAGLPEVPLPAELPAPPELPALPELPAPDLTAALP